MKRWTALAVASAAVLLPSVPSQASAHPIPVQGHPVASPGPGAGLSAHVTWIVSNPSAAANVTDWLVSAMTLDGSVPSVTVPVSARSANVPVPATGMDYRFRVTGLTASGRTTASQASNGYLPPFPSAEAFADQLDHDFIGPGKVSSVHQALVATVSRGDSPAPAIVNVAGSEQTSTDPVIRLYLSFYGRRPDIGGYRYWRSQRQAGLRVVQIAAVFARSHEFVAKYGALDDPAFVHRAYVNVFDRADDFDGETYWVKRLASGVTRRPQLMTDFSESNEHQVRSRRQVATVVYFAGLLGRMPSAAEVSTWSVVSLSDMEYRLAKSLVESAEYAARVS